MSKKNSDARTSDASESIPSPDAYAHELGVTLTPKLENAQIFRLRKPLPGYVGMLDDAALLLEKEANLVLPDVTPEALRAIHIERNDLAQREAVAETVYRSAYEQRLVLDDRAMAMLQKIARRVVALSEDDPSMLVRWRALLDYLAAFRPGPKPKAPASPAA